jgi:hypothetical protein
MREAKSRIEALKASKQYVGEAKEQADFAYINAMEWHNELLAESKITSEEALSWKHAVENKIAKLLKKKDKEPTSKLDEQIADALVEMKDAEENYNSTYAGQEDLKSQIALTEDSIIKKDLEKQLADGAALHAKQIIATALVDRKRAKSDLPIQVGNAIDLKVLSKQEQEEYAVWIDAVRFDKQQVTNRDLIMKQTFTSIYKRVNDSETGTEWRIRPNPNHKGWRIPEYVSRALYLMPNSTERISLIKFNYKNAYEILKTSKKQNDMNSAEYKVWAEAKYDLDRIKRFLK